MFNVRRRLSVTRVVAWLRAAITAEWHGPPDLSRSLTMEWRLIVARWVGIVAVAPALPLLHLSPTRLVVAYAILLAAVAYNIAIRLWLPRRPQWFASGYFTTVCDSLASIAMVLVGGGFANSIGYVLFTISISVAMRYGYGPSMAMTGLFIGCDLLESMAFGQTPDAPFALRSGFLLITAFLASYLRRLAEKAEKALHDRLVELQRLYSDLAIAHQELLSLDEAKTNFLANVSHELRTPLTSIRALSEMLLSYEDTEVQHEFISIISSESERLTRLVNDVLDVTKIEAGQMDWSEDTIELSELLEHCTRTFNPLLDQTQLTFKAEIAQSLPTIRGDRDRIQQVIQNLLNNALKFTYQGGITLRAFARGGDVCIAVADTGLGIARQDQQRVFEKFQQVGDTLTGKPKGTGLGLTICRDIVAHHGGRLTLTSQPGLGSTFSIWLPISKPSEERLAA